MDVTCRIVAVGASVGGVAVAEALRAEGFEGSITLIGDEAHRPYQRPPLSKQVFTGEWSVDRTRLLDEAEFERLGIRLVLGSPATALDVAGHAVTVGGRSIQYDTCIIATGVKANRLAGVRGIAGVHCLRTIDDVDALRTDLATARRVVVVGSGVLGSEIASAARKLGLEVVLVGRTRKLRLGQVGDRLSTLIEQLHRDNGVDLRMGVTVVEVKGEGRVEAVVLSDGSVVPADVVVTAIGATPATDWLAGSGIELDDGVVCDDTGLAAPDVYAVGDVARWRDAEGQLVSRAEHHLNAIQQALAVAHLLMTGERPAPVVPFFWSEVHGTRIQAYGRFAPGADLEIVAGDPAGRRFVAASRRDDGTATGVVGWNMPREFRESRSLIDEPRLPQREGILS